MGHNLTGQTAIITGAGSGLGAAIARALASEGARCVLAGRRREPLEQVRLETIAPEAERSGVGDLARAIPCDVRDEAQIEKLVAQTVAEFGGVDILVNNAGVFHEVPLTETTTALWDETIAVNLRGAFLLCRAVWPHMQRRGGGQIVNVSSVSGVQGYADEAAYCASKFGLNGLTAALALEGKPRNIRVFAVCPGAVDTHIWGAAVAPEVTRRMMRAEQIAELVRWLITAPRNLDFGPIVVRNFTDPWEEGA
jgi:3-oxoacyl-[acyl-carrier protein] reductase